MRWGLSAEEIDELRRELQGEASGDLWPDHVGAVTAFLAASTQWRTGIGVSDGRLRTLFVGLDYAGARVAWDALGVVIVDADWRRLAVLEEAARDVLNGAAG